MKMSRDWPVMAILHHSRILLGSMGVSGELPKTKHL
jgi:hypothetical protein